MKVKQFPVIRFARGVRLNVEHVFDPLTAIKTAAASANLQDTQEELGAWKSQWTLPFIGARAAEEQFVLPDGTVSETLLVWPWLIPPFQQKFVRATLADPQYPLKLIELSLSIDQAANPFAILDGGNVLKNADMSRYNMTLQLWERTPSLLNATTPGNATTGDLNSATEILNVTIDGVDAFGLGQKNSSIARANPLVVSELQLSIKPWCVYHWTLNCAGLFSANVAAIKDVWVCTVSGTPLVGSTARLTIGPANYDHLVLAGDTYTAIAAAIAVLAAADAHYVVTASGPVVTCTAIAAGIPAFGVSSRFLAGDGKFVAVHAVTGSGAATGDSLTLISLNLVGTFEAPLTVRDRASDFSGVLQPGIQNIPIKHLGADQGTVIPLTIPIAGDTITGDDIQDALHGFDRVLRQRAASGYGAGFGALSSPLLAADAMPTELLANDSCISMIVVPMWSGQAMESIRKTDIAPAGVVDGDNPMGFQNTAYPYTKPMADSRIIPVPEGFVLHHAFAVWGGYSPTNTQISPARAARGTWPTAAEYHQEIGIMLNSGGHSDDYKVQMAAYLEWTGAVFKTYLLDQFGSNSAPFYRIMQIPLVCDAAHTWDAHSWFRSGQPIFMGQGNSNTQLRTKAATLSAVPGGATPGGADVDPPATNGREQYLEIRWNKSMTDITRLVATDVIVSQGGEFVILIGKQTVVA